MLLGRPVDLQGFRHRLLHLLLIVQQHQCQYIDHLSVTTRSLEPLFLQLFKALGQFIKGGTIAQSPWLALYHRQVVRCSSPDATTAIEHVLLNLALLPAGCRVAELGFEQIVTDHGSKTLVHIPLLALADFIHSGLHVVIDTTLRHTTEGNKGMVVGIEQHLVALHQVGPQEECTAVAELEVSDQQLGVNAIDDCIVPIVA